MSLATPAKLYIAAVVAVAMAVLPLAYGLSPTPPAVTAVLTFGLLVFLSESFAVKLPTAGNVSVSFTIIMAAIILYGPLSAGLSACFAIVAYSGEPGDMSLYRRLFNGSESVVSAVTAGLMYTVTGGIVFSQTGRSYILADFPFQLAPLVVLAATYFLINSGLVAGIIALYQGQSFRSIWSANFQGVIYNYLAFTPLAIALADTYMRAGYLGLLLMALPLVVARQTFKIYMNLREAYWGTVQSLIAALEAKDGYTSGHSQRVADLADKVGRRMKLTEKDMTLLHYAATLHDIGKIGTARSILRKPGKLSEDEYHRMRLHPESGALIIQEIEFLKEVVPIVFHHHERVDGTGYGDGLSGDDIPLLARILSVADAYDAMTSPRPYRDLLSPQAACEELTNCVGTQFDAEVVKVLVEIVLAPPSEQPVADDAVEGVVPG